MAKHGRIADDGRLQLVPAVVSHTNQIHDKRLTREQIRQRLICFEGQAKRSNIRSIMKWWSKRLCISMVIAKTASRSVTFKAAKVSDTVLSGQFAVILMSEVEGGGAYCYHC